MFAVRTRLLTSFRKALKIYSQIKEMNLAAGESIKVTDDRLIWIDLEVILIVVLI